MKHSDQIIKWIQMKFEEMGRDTAVLGISGGKDSTVVAALLERALGADNVVGVLMPNGAQADIEDSWTVVNELGIHHQLVNLAETDQAIRNALRVVSAEAAVNIVPRLRMTVLYAISQSLSAEGRHACVVGTGNRAERFVGYTTKWGDSACDINPIQELWVHEVVSVGKELSRFPQIVQKEPSDGLCGQSDEAQLGFSYEDVFHFAEGNMAVSDEKYEKIRRRHQAAQHKLSPIPFFENNE